MNAVQNLLNAILRRVNTPMSRTGMETNETPKQKIDVQIARDLLERIFLQIKRKETEFIQNAFSRVHAHGIDNYPLYLNGKDLMKILQVSRDMAYKTLSECPYTITRGKTRKVHRNDFYEWLKSKESELRKWTKKR